MQRTIEKNRTHLVSVRGVGNNSYENNPEAVATDLLWVYQCCKGMAILIKALLMIGAVVNYGICARDCPEGTWDFPVVIQMEHR